MTAVGHPEPRSRPAPPGSAAPVTVNPADLGEVRAALGDTTGVLSFVGAGTKRAWGSPGAAAEVVVATGALDRLVEHSAGDMIAVVQPGLPLSALQSALAAHGQRLAIDPPAAERGATVGGIFAAGDAGPLRHRFGTLRDLAIGVTAVLADGTVAHAGGRVVKNVAGFDLTRLLCGSLGTLAFVAELVVRLHPLPEVSRTLRVPADPAAATRLTLAIAASPLVVAAVDWRSDDQSGPSGPGLLSVRLEGRPAGVAAQADTLRALIAATTGSGIASQAELLDGADAGPVAVADAAALAAAHTGVDGETVARAATLPGDLAVAAEALARATAAGPVEAALASHAGVGLHSARLRGGDPAAHAAVVRRWRAAVVARGGSVVLHRRIPGVDGLVDAWYDDPASAPSALGVMRRVKAQLDPGNRCAPGSFVGGI